MSIPRQTPSQELLRSPSSPNPDTLMWGWLQDDGHLPFSRSTSVLTRDLAAAAERYASTVSQVRLWSCHHRESKGHPDLERQVAEDLAHALVEAEAARVHLLRQLRALETLLWA